METPETLLEKASRSALVKRTAITLTLLGIILCFIALLPPAQDWASGYLDAGSAERGLRIGASSSQFESFLSLPFALLAASLFLLSCLYAKKLSLFLEDAHNEKAIKVVCGGITWAALVFISLFSYNKGWQWLNSDHASEMILGKTLANENALLSRNWHYSTEIRVVYQTFFIMPLFKLLGRFNNWTLIRSLTIFFNNALLMASYNFCARRLKIPPKWISVTGIFLLIPLSQEYWDIVTFGGYYVFFIAQMFFCVGLYAGLVNHPGGIKKLILPFALFTLSCAALGSQGIRALMCVHLPLLISSIIIFMRTKERIFHLFLGVYSFVLCGVGFLANAVLHFWYSFHSYDAMTFEGNPFKIMSKFGESFMKMASFFGFSPDNPMLSSEGIFGGAAIIGAAALVWHCCKALRKRDPLGLEKPDANFLLTFFITAVTVNLLIFILAAEDLTGRHFIPFMILYIPILAALFDQAERTYGYVKRAAIIFGITLFIAGQGYLTFQALRKINLNEERSGYIQYLLDNNLDYGFATFWNANVTTELTNGSVELAGLAPQGFNYSAAGSLVLRAWLNSRQYFDPSYHEGESFLLLTSAEWETSRRSKKRLVEPDYRDRRFVVKRFDSAGIIHQEILDP